MTIDVRMVMAVELFRLAFCPSSPRSQNTNPDIKNNDNDDVRHICDVGSVGQKCDCTVNRSRVVL